MPKLVNNSTKFNGLYIKDNDSVGFSSGENVKSIALLFSSLREGFRGLPKKFKDYGDEQLEMLDRYAKNYYTFNPERFCRGKYDSKLRNKYFR